MSADRTEGPESFGTFLYNKAEGTVLGRNGTSWAKIGAFYLVFYSFLACWFAAMLGIFFTTLREDNMPQYSPGAGDSLLKKVAMAYRPQAKKSNIESTLIWYDADYRPEAGDNPEYDHWVKNLNDSVAMYHDYDKSVTYEQCDPTADPPKVANKTLNIVCDFKVSDLGHHCSAENRWGYDAGEPCVLLKLNKMIGWQPEVYKNLKEIEAADMPETLKAEIRSQKNADDTIPAKVWVECMGKHNPDNDEFKDITYHPAQGFDAKYFPYDNTHGYRAPLVAVRFHKPSVNIVVSIECKAYAKNIKPDRAERTGVIDFELLIDTMNTTIVESTRH